MPQTASAYLCIVPFICERLVSKAGGMCRVADFVTKNSLDRRQKKV